MVSIDELPERLDVIAVGAHPDDVEVACGGTLAKLSSQGYRVGIIDLTDGEPTPHSAGPEARRAEAKAAAHTLGAVVREILSLPNRRLFDCFESRVELAKQFRRYRPRVVIGFGDRTPLASPDHWQATLITEAAVFYSRLTKWDEHFAGLPPHAISRQLYFRVPLEPDSPAGYSQQVTVDIGATLETKIASIRCYQSQFAHKDHVLDCVRAAAKLSGQAAGVAAGEVFHAPRPIAIDDLVATLLPRGEFLL